ncbi:hypothetical protein K8I85_00885 [bacterium]|nr:hypothetical protein [bacterium]
MTKAICGAIITGWLLVMSPVACWGQTDADSVLVSELSAAESTVDSLRAEIRELDRDIQAMKQDYADAGDVTQLLEALGDPAGGDPDAPEDTRSRRQRVDALLRAITQRSGQLRFNGGATVVAQDLIAGEEDAAAGTGSFDLYAHTSFGPNTLLFFAFEVGGGQGLDGVLPASTPINGDAAPTRDDEGFDHLVLNEAWAEFTALGDAVILTAGKIDLSNYFDINAVANDETAQFLAGAFVNSASLLVPAPGPGLRARTVLLRRFSAQIGLASDDSTGGTRFRDVFMIGSVGAKVLAETEYDGNVRVYVFSPPGAGSARGWGLSMDQQVAASVSAFGRYGRNDMELSVDGTVRSAWSAGLQWKGTWRRRALVAGAAYGEARDAAESETRNFEVYLSSQVNTWTHVSPHVQVVRDKATMSKAATALGVRVQFNF